MAVGADENESCGDLLSTKILGLLELATEVLRAEIWREEEEEKGRCLLRKSVSRSGRPFLRACLPIGRVHGCRARRGSGTTFCRRNGKK